MTEQEIRSVRRTERLVHALSLATLAAFFVHGMVFFA